MEPTPWRTDRLLDEARVRATLGEQFPELSPVLVRPFAEGWDSEGWLVDDETLFMFPKRRDVVAPFERGLRLLPVLRERLPVRVPEVEHVGRPGRHFPYPFAGYPLIRGVAACEIVPSREHWPGLAAECGQVLALLHTTALSALPDDLPVEEQRYWTVPLSDEAADALRLALPDVPIEPYLTGTAEAPPPFDGKLVPAHSDLLDYHVLLDEEGRRVRGIIDWFDARCTDPAGDFVGLYLWLGEEFLELLIDAYELPIDAGFRDRIRHRGRQVAVVELGAGLDPTSPQDPDATRRWVRNAFGV